LGGTTRAFTADVQATIKPLMQRVAEGIAASAGCTVDLDYHTGYPPTINTADEVELSANAAEQIVGAANLNRDVTPLMGAEDFSFMLQKRPGSYVWIGNGPGEGGCTLHNPHYDFSDDVLPIGASYWAKLTESVLAK